MPRSRAHDTDGRGLSRTQTAMYAAPQVLTSELGYDGRLSDVWSAGVVLYILLTGCRSSSTYTTAWDLSCPLRHAATVQCVLPALQKPCERAVSQSMMQLNAENRWRSRLAICAAGWPREIRAETTRCFPFLETAEENDDPVAKMRAMFPRIVQGAFLPIHSSVRASRMCQPCPAVKQPPAGGTPSPFHRCAAPQSGVRCRLRR